MGDWTERRTGRVGPSHSRVQVHPRRGPLAHGLHPLHRIMSTKISRDEARPTLGRAAFGGLTGTFLIGIVEYGLMPGLVGGLADLVGLLGSRFGAGWLLGLPLYFLIGTLLLPWLYVATAYPMLFGAPWARGVVFGLGLWLLVEAVAMPLLGAGVFHARLGGGVAVLLSLVGHVVYGATVGAFAGEADAA